MPDHFGCSGLFADDDGDPMGDCFESDEAERFGERWHDEARRFTEETVYLFRGDFSGEYHAIFQSRGARMIDEVMECGSVSGHDKLHLGADGMYLKRDTEELFGVLLDGQASEEENERVAQRMAVPKDRMRRIGDMMRIVNHMDFVRRDSVLLYEDVFGVIADRNDAIRGQKAFAFAFKNPCVGSKVCPVEFRCMNVGKERNAMMPCGTLSCFVGHPIMTVHDVGVKMFCHIQASQSVLFDGLTEIVIVEQVVLP